MISSAMRMRSSLDADAYVFYIGSRIEHFILEKEIETEPETHLCNFHGRRDYWYDTYPYLHRSTPSSHATESTQHKCSSWLMERGYLDTRTESIAMLPPFGPLEEHKWIDQISSQWESQKKRFALIFFGKIQFLPPCNWNLPFMSYRLW